MSLDERSSLNGLVPQSISHWFAQLYAERPLEHRNPLTVDVDADVCIIGAGFTGLWTAYELLRERPDMSIRVLEAEVAGYGASGRNGGAVIALIQGTRDQWAARRDRAGAIALERAMIDTVDEIGAVVAAEGIDCSFSKNGVIEVARTPLELRHFAETVDRDRSWGFGPDNYRMLDGDETRARVAVDGALGARFSPHCASIHPGGLIRGLAEAVERRGGVIYEGSPAIEMRPGVVRTPAGKVRARYIVRATEAYTESIPSARGQIVPVHTSMLVTEPVPGSVWERIGWHGREALLAEHPFLHLQHTADGRITIGGDDRRVPYRYGSRPSPLGPAPARMREFYRHQLVKLFPELATVRIERSWQGVFGAPRTWMPGVHMDTTTGLGWAGGYVGEGVAPSNLAARTLRDLILGRDTPLTALPWVVDRAPRRWEPEPLRYVGSGLIWGMRMLGQYAETRTGRPSRLLTVANRIAGYQGHG